MANLHKIFPIIDIKEKKILNSKEVISIAFSVEHKEVFLESKEYYNSLQERLAVCIKQLPDYCILQHISFYDEENFVPDYTTPDNFIQKHNKLHYLGRSIPNEKHYIVLSFAQKQLGNSLSDHSITDTLRYLVKNPYSNYKENLEKIDTEIENTITILESVFDENQIKRLNDDEIQLMLFQYYSLDYNYSGETENLKLPNIDFKKNIIGEYNLGFISIYEGREATSFRKASQTRPGMVKSDIKQVKEIGNICQSQMFPLTIGLPFKHAYCVVIQKLPVQKLMLNFELQERALSLPATFGLNQAINKLRDIEIFKSAVHDEGYTPVYVSMGLIIPTKGDKALLNLRMEAAKSAIANISEMRGIVETDEACLSFISHSPGNGSSCYKHNLTTSNHAVSYIPKESHYKSDNKGFPFIDRYGKEILVDILNNKHMTNKNGIVIGPSGRGKSYTLNYIVSVIYNEGHVFIIDKGGSYQRLCSIFNGQYLDSANEEQFRFAIFETIKDNEGNYIVETIHKNFILSVMVFIWKHGEPVLAVEKTILTEIIENYYIEVNSKKVTATFTGFYDFVKMFAPKMEEGKKKFFDYENFLIMAYNYAYGEERKLLNSEKNIDLTYEKFTVFEMGAIEKSNPVKFNLLCLIITFLNIKKIQKLDRSVFKTFIIDEALSFLKGDIGEFIGNLFAEVRKENGQVLVVAQGLNFLLEASTEVQEKIFSNRDFIVMTNHEGYGNAFQNYREKLDFSEKDIELLSSVTRNEEIFMRLGSHGMILRIDVSQEVHGLFTTHPQEMKTIKELEKEKGSIQSAIVEFARQKKSKI